MKVNENMTDIEKEIFNKVRFLLTLDLIPEKFQDKKVDSLMYGHCYHATLAMYNLLGGKEAGYKVKSTFDNNKIKITELCEELKINRKTFYNLNLNIYLKEVCKN